MRHCVECRYWESSDLDTSDGRAICLKLTEATVHGPMKRLCIIRTTGDHTCDFFKPMTAEQLLGTSH